jgi:hypothetical protein
VRTVQTRAANADQHARNDKRDALAAQKAKQAAQRCANNADQHARNTNQDARASQTRAANAQARADDADQHALAAQIHTANAVEVARAAEKKAANADQHARNAKRDAMNAVERLNSAVSESDDRVKALGKARTAHASLEEVPAASAVLEALDEEALTTLASVPEWPVIGSVDATVDELINAVVGDHSAQPPDGLTRASSTKLSENERRTRDDMPFYYVLNPPRHGKSLLLDRIAQRSIRKGVAVIGVTYNGAFPVADWEHQSAAAAVCGLRVRMLFAAAGARSPAMWKTCEKIALRLDPPVATLRQMMKDKRLLVLVDEITKLTDQLSPTDQLSLWQEMFKMQQCGCRFIMTGFNASPMKSFQSSGYAWVQRALQQCEPDEAGKLGRVLYHVHGRLRHPFPHFIYEVCKATPGLLGTLLWATKTEGPAQSLSVFHECIPWVGHLLSNAHTLWPLVRNVFVESDQVTAMKEAEAAELTVRLTDKTPELSPFAVAIIVDRLQTQATHVEEVKSMHTHASDALLQVLSACIDCCRRRGVRGTAGDVQLSQAQREAVDAVCGARAPAPQEPSGTAMTSGKPFEDFTAQAIALQLMTSAAHKERPVQASAAVRLFGNVQHMRNKQREQPVVHVYFLETRRRICALIGALPYRLFPCGFELLHTAPTIKETKGTLKATPPAAVPPPIVNVQPSQQMLPSCFNQPATCDPFLAEHGVHLLPGAFDVNQEPALSKALTAMFASDVSSPELSGVSQPMLKCARSARALQELIVTHRENRSHFVLVPTDDSNPLCDVISVCFESQTKVHVCLVECRDRRQIKLDDWVQKPLLLGRCVTALPYLVESLLERYEIDVTVHLVVAGRCGDSATLADIEQALMPATPVQPAADDDDEDQ